jgi:hypothetical protein
VQSAAESTAPGLRWDWNVNRGTSQLGIDARNAYPGDGYVDIVGVDSYDGWPGATTEATWNEHYNGSYGLKFWADFARQHGKKLSIPEWGVYPGTAWAGHNGGDNPFYIAKMFGFFQEQKDNLAYESYFNEAASYYAGALDMNPRAAAEYQKQIGVALDRRRGRPGADHPGPDHPTDRHAGHRPDDGAPGPDGHRHRSRRHHHPDRDRHRDRSRGDRHRPGRCGRPRGDRHRHRAGPPAVTVTAPAAPAVTVTAPAAPRSP